MSKGCLGDLSSAAATLACLLLASVTQAALPAPKVDLIASNVRLDDAGKLYVTVQNVGGAVLLSGFGKVVVFVDHWRAGQFSIPSGLAVDASVEFDTGIQLHGEHRRILVHVDPDDLIAESDEYFNSLSIDVSAPVRTGFDLHVEAAVEDRNGIKQIFYIIKNLGTIDSPAGMPVTFRVFTNPTGSELVSSARTIILPSIPASCDPAACAATDCTTGTCVTGDCISRVKTCDAYCEATTCAAGDTCVSGACEIYVAPDNPVTTVANGSYRRIEMEYGNGFTDLDSVNNRFEATMRYVTLAEIQATYGDTNGGMLEGLLASKPDLMDWPPACTATPSAPCATQTVNVDAFGAWPSAYVDELAPSKEQLWDYLLRLEQGRELPIEAPPTPVYPTPGTTAVTTIVGQSVIDNYLSYVAQSLWFEQNGQDKFGISAQEWNRWSLAAIDPDTELAYLYLNPHTFLALWDDGAGPGGRSYLTEVVSIDLSGGQFQETNFPRGRVVPWNARVMYHFMDHLGMIRSTQAATFEAMSNWWRTYSRHSDGPAQSPPQTQETYDYGGKPPAHAVYYNWVAGGGRGSPGGCNGAAPQWTATFSAINFVTYSRVGAAGLAGHRAVHLPTLSRPACGGDGEPYCCGAQYYEEVYNGVVDAAAACCSDPPCDDTSGIATYHADDLYFGSHGPTWGVGVHSDSQILSNWRAWKTAESVETLYDGVPCDCDQGTPCDSCAINSNGCDPGTSYLYCGFPEACDDRTCNSYYGQQDYNSYRDEALAALEFASPKWLVLKACESLCSTCPCPFPCDGTAVCDGLAPKIDGPFVLPILDSSEQAALRTRLNDVITSLGSNLDVATWLADARDNRSIAGSGYSAPTGTVSSMPVLYPYTQEYVYVNSSFELWTPSEFPSFWTCDDPSVVITDPSLNAACATAPSQAGILTCTLWATNGVVMGWDSVTIEVISADPPSSALSVNVSNGGSRYLAVALWAADAATPFAINVTSNDPKVGCVDLYVQLDGSLAPGAVYRTNAEWSAASGCGPIHVSGAAIIPGSVYAVRLVSVDGVVSDSSSITTLTWGDVDGDSRADFKDIGEVVAAFLGTEYRAGSKYVYDLVGTIELGRCEPDGQRIDFLDLNESVNAFTGTTPLDCPTCCDDFECSGQRCCGGYCQECCTSDDCGGGVCTNGVCGG